VVHVVRSQLRCRAAGLRRRRVRTGDKWPLDEVALKIRGKRHWLWRAADQHGVVLDILVQERRDQVAAERFLRRVLDGEGGTEPRVVITDKLASYPPAIRRALPNAEDRRHKGLNNRAENSRLPTRKRVGLFMLLGYRFSPRLADLGETRFYRINSSANYGPLNSVARHRINTDLITRNWDDLLRVAGSLKLGFVSAHDLMRTFQGSGRNCTLARALSEYGRIGKTLYLLDLVDDEAYRRSLLIQVNKGERRHGLARTVFHGRGGELRQAYREGQEDQLGALGLVLNAIVLWNTRYMGLALDELRAAGKVIQPEDVERRYSFSLPEPLAHGQLRELRDPNDPAEQVFDLVAATA
jgi:hypothetical protein